MKDLTLLQNPVSQKNLCQTKYNASYSVSSYDRRSVVLFLGKEKGNVAVRKFLKVVSLAKLVPIAKLNGKWVNQKNDSFEEVSVVLAGRSSIVCSLGYLSLSHEEEEKRIQSLRCHLDGYNAIHYVSQGRLESL